MRATRGGFAKPFRTACEVTMNDEIQSHRYGIGETVTLSAGFGYAREAETVYSIVALLPSNGAQLQYRIRSEMEKFERVAAENELSPPREQ